MAEEWKPAEDPEAKPEEVVEEPDEAVPPQMSAFIQETADLFEKMKKPPEQDKPEEERKPDAQPRIQESAVPKEKDEDTGFIPDLAKATPEELKKRIDYLYGKDKHNERLWKEAQDFIKNQKEETERLRAELAKREIARSEEELNAMQLQVVDLLDRNSPNYNPAEGAKLLRELTTRDVQLKEARDAETKREEEFKETLEKQETEKTVERTAQIITDWSQTREYAQEGHPLYPHVVEWLRRAYHEAPEHVTVAQIVERCQQVFDNYVKQGGAPAPERGNGRDVGGQRPPGAGERVTVSQVIGTPQRGQRAPTSAGERLNSSERQVALKLFPNVPREQAYSMYAEGKG